MSKIKRDAFLFMAGKDKEFAQCGTCIHFLEGTNRCGLFDLNTEVFADSSCGLYVQGEFLDIQPKDQVKPEVAGLVHRKVQCGNCNFFDNKESKCGMFKKFNAFFPDEYELDVKVKENDCCNLQEPIGSITPTVIDGPETLEEWRKRVVPRFNQFDWAQIQHVEFFRDESRTIILDPNLIYSPADGIILYAQEVTPAEKIEIKGKHYTLTDIMTEKYAPKGKAIVVGIFMTFFHQHWNKMPTNGYLSYEPLPAISSANMPLEYVESDLYAGKFDQALTKVDYLKNNQRTINQIYNSNHQFRYSVIQIADTEVDQIMPANPTQNSYYPQGQTFGLIRWGSQVDLVIDLDQDTKFEILIKPKLCVRAGVDAIIKVK